MLRTFLRQSLVVLAAVALFLPVAVYYGPPSQAMSISINNDTCSSPSASVDGQGNVTITCGGGGPPVCSISGPSSGVIGTAITLTANCSNNPTTWGWGGGQGTITNCGGASSSTTSTCTDNGGGLANGTNVTYTLTASNGSGSDTQRTKTVNWSNTVAAPTGCTISGAPGGSQAAGYPATLSVNCNGGTPASYSWTGTGASTCTTQVCGPFAVNATTTFTATATNAGGSNTSPAVTITIGGGGGGPISCAGYANTHVIDLSNKAQTAGSGAQVITQNYGGFGQNDAVVVKFVANPPLTTQTTNGKLAGAEFGDLPAPRYGALSASPCDFTNGIAYTCTNKKTGSVTTAYSVITPGTQTPLNSFATAASASCQPILTPGVPYYWNLTNVDPRTGLTGCTASATCNMTLTLQAPSGQ